MNGTPHGVAVAFVLRGCGKPGEAKEKRLRYFYFFFKLPQMKRLLMVAIIATLFILQSCSKSSDNKPVVNNYYIGEEYGGGIIFYIDATGQHGLISSMQDQSNACIWSPSTPNLILPKDIGYGQSNTSTIEMTFGSGNYAALYCTSYKGGGFNDWYLPSLNELDLMYKNKLSIGSFSLTTSSYWSSTTGTTGKYAFTEDFFTGIQTGHDPLRNNVSVRAIRSY